MAIEPIKGFYVHDEVTDTDGVAKIDGSAVTGFDDVLNYLYEENIVEKEASFTTSQGNAILATEKLIYIEIPSGTTFKYAITGASGTLTQYAIYYYDRADTRHNFAEHRVLNMEYEYTAPSSIKALAIYCAQAEVRATETLDISVSYIANINSDSVESQLQKIDQKLDNPSIILSGKFVYGSLTAEANQTTTRARSVYNNKVTGKLVVNGLKSLGYALAIMAWDDQPFGNIIYNSGFMVTDTFEYDLSDSYVGIAVRKEPDSTDALELDTINSLSIDAYIKLLDNNNPLIRLDNKVSDLGKDVLLMQTVKTIAHKGDQIVAPQCTKPAYVTARKRGIRIVEGDVNLSEDGQFVVWHDTTLWALGNLVDINGYLMYTDGTSYYYVKDSQVYTWDGTSYVLSSVALGTLTRCGGWAYGVKSGTDIKGLPLNILKRIDFGAYKGYPGTQILTFNEWVDLCKMLGMEMYIDSKITYTSEQLTTLANVVKSKGMSGFASWLSVPLDLIPTLRQILPTSRIGVLQHPDTWNITAYQDYNNGRGVFFNGDAKTGMTSESIQLGLSAGYDVEVYYVDYGTATESDIFDVIRQAVGFGVKALTLDHYTVDDSFAYLFDD